MTGQIPEQKHLAMGQQESRIEDDTSDGSFGIKLRVLSWNIDGLDGRDLRERTSAVIDFIKQRSPHVIFLQEIVPQTLSMLHTKLGRSYSIHINPKLKFQYFSVILVTKTCPKKISIEGEVGAFDFPGSSMGRHLVQLFIKVCGVPMALYTSHLESMRDYSKERTEQLKMCFEFVSEQKELFQRACIFGGDLNLRNEEVAKVGLPDSTVDVWEACGSVKEHEYTWDISANDNLNWSYPNKPQLRFDRLYLTDNGNKMVKPISFELVGKERIPTCHNRFPSDHWGMYTVVDVTEVIAVD